MRGELWNYRLRILFTKCTKWDYRPIIARLPRLVIPGIAYHVTQRGNRRAQTFFEDGDYALYRDLLAQSAERAGAEVWSYCSYVELTWITATLYLMPQQRCLRVHRERQR